MKTRIPKGLKHLKLISRESNKVREKSTIKSKKHSVKLKIIGTSLSALYQAAVCHRQCFNNGHVLEALAGRTYNLGCAAYLLINQGFYDEALNLIRSIGEIANLIQLSLYSPEALREWLDSDEKKRKTKFSPMKIRVLIEETGDRPFVADQDWYAKFCEEYTHITPDTKPNSHSGIDEIVAGGIFQDKGLEYSLDQLAMLLCVIGRMICLYFKFDDLLSEIDSYVRDTEIEK